MKSHRCGPETNSTTRPTRKRLRTVGDTRNTKARAAIEQSNQAPAVALSYVGFGRLVLTLRQHPDVQHNSGWEYWTELILAHPRANGSTAPPSLSTTRTKAKRAGSTNSDNRKR